jgi:hypothetical protein
LIVNQGDAVTVNLTNVNIPEGVSLNFKGQSLAPDLSAGVSAGSGTSYSFTASKPGTFLYQAGVGLGKQHQVAMGMYGALVVKPTDGTAYGSPATVYTEEAAVVLSEVDPALNGSATPAAFDMRNYAPKYFLINGKAYVSGFTGDIEVTQGSHLLLRYVNAGLQSHAMSTLGIAQKVIATDGFAFAHPHSMVAETIATGQTLDTLVTIPSSAPLGTQFSLFDANLMLRNANGTGLGGMLTFLKVTTPGGGVTGPDLTGPAVSGLSLAPAKVGGASPSDVTINASISDAGLGNSNIAAARYYIDSTNGAPTSMTAVDSAFDSPTEAVTAQILSATLAGLSSGNHTILVQGQDSAGNWGALTSATLSVDKTGPTTSGLTLNPNPSSGAVSVALSGTASDTTSGNSNVTAAEYWVDSGAHTPITIGSPAPSVSLNATIPAGLSQGAHVVSVRSQDSFGNWGAVATITLQVGDTQAPTTSGVSASPNPNNGSMPYNTSIQAVRVIASFSDVATGNSNIAAAEGFIDTVGTTGSGFVFIATDGSFNIPAESGYSDIPLAAIGTLTSGNHTIYVHAKDAAGNWGAMATTVLVIDKTPPTIVSITRIGANPTNAASVQWLVTFSESVTGVTASNFNLTETLSGSTAVTSVTGTGATRTVTATTGNNSGTIRLNLANPTNIKDLVGNAMTSAGLPYTGGETYTIDRTAPTVSSINRSSPASSTTNATSVQFLVTFSESVNGGSASNFTLATTGSVAGASITSVSAGPGNTRTVTVNTGTGSGSIGLNKTSNTGITDLAGNAMTGGNFTGQVYTIDKTAPTVSSINRSNPNPTTSSSVSFIVTFSESVTGGAISNFSLTTTGSYSIAPSITSISGSGTTRTVTINTGTNSGAGTHTIRLDMVNSTGVTDAGGNAVSNLPYTSGQSYTKN